jgi:signal transduction histidine kinase
MAHEINNPLAGILQNASVIKQRLMPELEANSRAGAEAGLDMAAFASYLNSRSINQMLENIIVSGTKASKLVSNMLAFIRRSGSKPELWKFSEIIDEVIELIGADYNINSSFDFKNIKILKIFNPEYKLWCDRSELEQVFINIIKNSAQALSEALTPEPEITISCLGLENNATVIEFIDNGPGIPDAEKERVFEPFYSSRKNGGGTGLGLFISWYIITENYGGKIEIPESRKGKTVFRLIIPSGREGLQN